MSSPTPAGLLAVFGEPGSLVPDAEFNDWYDNEHIPLRLAVPDMHSWSRWVATDARTPTYLALYDLASPTVLALPPYAELANTRSPRETDIWGKVGLLERRVYAALGEPLPPRAGAAYDPTQPGPYLTFVSADVPPELEDEFGRWYNEEHTALLAACPEWVRTTRFVLTESGAFGTDEELKGKVKAQKYLALHEWTDEKVRDTEAFQKAVGTEWSKKMLGSATSVEFRFFKLLRTWKRE